jgi:cytosine/adenosine deaminase-related metal-dependent hydrolase
MAELIDSGVTTFVDVLEAPNAIPGALEIECEIAEKAGLRGILCFEACQRMSPENAELGLKENADFVRMHTDKDALVRGMMSIHTLFTCERSYVHKAKRIADELQCDIHMHLSESVYEPDWSLAHYGKRPVEIYDALGFLDEHVLASSACSLRSASWISSLNAVCAPRICRCPTVRSAAGSRR